MAMSKRYMVTMKRSCSCSMPGVWRAVAHSEGAVAIYHSPKACGHVARDMDLGGHYHAVSRQTFVPKQYTAPLLTTNLQEEHSIFGGADRLRQCIDYAVERYNPRYIMIANSCVAGVIGDDTQAIARNAEQSWNIPVMTVPCSGFLDGEYYAGFYHAAQTLIDRFMNSQPIRANTVTLLGDHGGPNGVNAKELEMLLNAFGLQVHCYFPGYASRKKMKRVPASALCIPLGGRPQSYAWMQKLAANLQEKFGIPFLDQDYPVGWRGTKTWIRQLGELLGRERGALLAVAEQEKRLQLPVAQCRANMQTLKVVLGIGRPLMQLQLDWVFEFLTLAGVKLEGIVLFSGLTGEQREVIRQELQEYTAAPVREEQEGEAVIQAADILVTTHELEDESKRQFLLPVLPPLGTGGLIELLNKLARLATRTGRRNGVLYGW